MNNLAWSIYFLSFILIYGLRGQLSFPSFDTEIPQTTPNKHLNCKWVKSMSVSIKVLRLAKVIAMINTGDAMLHFSFPFEWLTGSFSSLSFFLKNTKFDTIKENDAAFIIICSFVLNEMYNRVLGSHIKDKYSYIQFLLLYSGKRLHLLCLLQQMQLMIVYSFLMRVNRIIFW